MTLPPLPKPDGTAETNKMPHPDGGYEFDEVAAWSEELVREYAQAAVLAERDACAALCEAEKASTQNDDDSDDPCVLGYAHGAEACASAIRARGE